MLVVYWKSGYSEGYSDLLPSRWFEAEGEWSFLKHDVKGPSGKRSTARLSLTVRGNVADLDYGGEHSDSNRDKFPIGVMRLVFEDRTRTSIREVQWKSEEATTFETEDVECRELTIPLEGLDHFDPLDLNDGRRKIERLVTLRQGQPAFRNALMAAYERRCAITGCEIEEVLQAAHISPYRGEHTNHVTNGLLLRADIHTLFDRGLIKVDRDYRVTASPVISAVYDLAETISLPRNPSHYPNRDAFAQKWQAS